jgi:hypothetical protein
VRPLPIPQLHDWRKMGLCLINFNKMTTCPEVIIITRVHSRGNVSAGFTYRLEILKPRASQFKGPQAKVYNKFNTAVIMYCTF